MAYRNRQPREFIAERVNQELKVDREKTCPLLLRVFIKVGDHHKADDYNGILPSPELQIYTWKNATLKELTDLIKGVTPLARRPNARLSFAFVYPDKSGKNVVRQVSQIFVNHRTKNDRQTLASLHFETGDFLDVAVHVA